MSTDVRLQPTDPSASATATVPRRTKAPLVSAKSLRMWHSYISAFITPTIVFFAFSGSLQVLKLHESHGSYAPSALVSLLASVHKDQVTAEPPRGPAPSIPGAGANGAGARAPGAAATGPRPLEAAPKLSTQLLKGLFVLEAFALIVTSVLGTWIGITHAKRARPFWITLAAGALLPILLLAF